MGSVPPAASGCTVSMPWWGCHTRTSSGTRVSLIRRVDERSVSTLRSACSPTSHTSRCVSCGCASEVTSIVRSPTRCSGTSGAQLQPSHATTSERGGGPSAEHMTLRVSSLPQRSKLASSPGTRCASTAREPMRP